VGFEPTISADKRPQEDALDRAATRTRNDDIALFCLGLGRCEL